MTFIRRVIRGTLSVLLFIVFGLGAVALVPLTLVLRDPARCHPFVRGSWRLLVKAFVLLRLIRLDVSTFDIPRGSILAASHPSLIDVVLIVSLVPHTLYVAKHGLRRNPFIGSIVRATALPDDATLIELARPYLEAGWNVLVFPEGTRSAAPGCLRQFHRGTVQLALRTGVPIVPVGIVSSSRILAHGQPAWDVGTETVRYAIRFGSAARYLAVAGESLFKAANRGTDELRRQIARLLEGASE